MSGFIAGKIIGTLVLVLFSAYFSATETAFASLNRTRLRTMAEDGNKKARLALSLSENYDKLLSTILIGNNIVNIAAASLGTILFVRLLGDMGATVSTIVLTVVVLIFGEITPKSAAKDNPERFAMFSAPFLRVLMTVLTPVNFLFTQWKKLVNRVVKPSDDSRMSQEELMMLVDEVQQEGTIDKDEGELLRNAIAFDETEAGDILTHRLDIEAVPMDATREEIAKAFSESGYSRLPVYVETIDDIRGVIHQKDFFTATGISDRPLSELMGPVEFVLASEKISDLLRKLQKAKTHVAVVLDEYGGTYGLITMEDILEELVGEIWDEHDEVIQFFREGEDGSLYISCNADVEDMCERLNLSFTDEMEACSSVSGWVVQELGKIPEVGDSFDYQNLRITVVKTDFRRVVEIRAELMPSEQAVV